ncbi:ECF transporter S component [Lactobacillus sp. PV034]|uniref:ECF transporter S component n=1 Tax=Lactobacillus sp. PV034 TaxID=2594495 RepID=UPI00223FFA81|nr:ECF transporter S component [Lactobacillus sp. PV034]QNQ80889.1 ECF transporter S component [Lactobacillus sp. PV034]
MRQKRVQTITIGAIFIAILIIQSFVPYLGYIRILPGLPSITIIPLTVALAGVLLGTGFGAAMGLVWGILSLILAYTQPGDLVSLMLFQNPIIAIIPRAAAGFAGGMIGQAANLQKRGQTIFVYVMAGLVTSAVNTLLVIGLTSLFFMRDPRILLHNLGQDQNQTPLIGILLTVLGMNGITEAIFTGFVTPFIALPVKKYLLKRIN